MFRLILGILFILALGAGLGWLADRPGNLTLQWQGREVQTSVFHAVVLLVLVIAICILLWSIFRAVLNSPASVGQYFRRKRQARGLEALSSGLIAIGSGDRDDAQRFASQARKALPNEPLTALLRAQAAQLTDDRATSRRIYEGMLNAPDTEVLGLRGLFLEAEREGEPVAARQFAERALRLNGKLKWASDALFTLQCKQKDWAGALETLKLAQKNGIADKAVAQRQRAVLLTAQAQVLEGEDDDKALALAGEAHMLAPGLITAGAIAGRLHASQGTTGKAAKILEAAWKKAPHPDLATAYAFARPGDSPRDRLARVRNLVRQTPHSIESPIALATAAIEAKEWGEARDTLEGLKDERQTQRVCALMAQIEGEQGREGRMREWLARAVNAKPDPVWTADGVVADDWSPTSPVTGNLDAFAWKVPEETIGRTGASILHQKLEALVAMGARPETVIEAPAALTNIDVADDDDDDAPPVTLTPLNVTPTQQPQTERPQASTAPTVAAAPDNVVDAPAAKAAVIVAPTAAAAAAAAASAVAAKVAEGAAAKEAVVEATATTTKAVKTAVADKAAAVVEPVSRVAREAAVEVRSSPSAAEDAVIVETSSGEHAADASSKAALTADAKSPTQDKDSTTDTNAKTDADTASAMGAKSDDNASSATKPTGKAAASDEASTKPAAAQPTPSKADVKAAEPTIFVPPRAPDDPGTEGRQGKGGSKRRARA
ncbi:MAG: heme biosynthesis HemY N-terminal domain-containing protein [Pseudomonadota bacterium]